MSPIVDAVTAVIVSGGELLMVQRQPFLSAFPGFHAFPGGKVDAADSEGEALPAFCEDVEPRLARGLLRELREELAVDLATLPGAVRIRHLGIALTPPTQPRRFNTHFFAIELAEKPAIAIDLHEIRDAEWATPAAWRVRAGDGQLLAAPPTRAVIEALAAAARLDAVKDIEFLPRHGYELPLIEQIEGVRNIYVRSHTLPPAEHTNCFLLGDSQSHRILVDPSPASDEEMAKLCRLVDRFGIHEVFLTHHHPDHHERAPDIARQLGVPIGMSEDTQQRLLAKMGANYFHDLAVHHYRDQDVICHWLGRPVRIYEVPGHDEGQLALMPDDRAWCIVGDLIQGIGTVVIAKPEGNMRKYYASLERLIGLAPRVIIPSHGSALGTVFRLEETLKHRRQREDQVLALWRAGHDLDTMLKTIYAQLDPRLLVLARLNIESHLDKLRDEGVITRSA